MKFQQRFIFILTLFIIAYKYTIGQAVADNDLWHRLAVGKIFSQLGTVAKHDIFAYVPTKSIWVDHEWGSGVVFYFLAEHFGDLGLLILKLTVFLAILGLIYLTNTLISKNREDFKIGFYVVSLLVIVLGFVCTVRSMIFTYLFFTLWIYVLERLRRGENRLIWIFPATMLLWANMHAGFLAGFGLLVLYIVGEVLNKKNPFKYIGILALCLPVTLINPYGLKFWKYVIDAVTMKRPYVTEWMPTNLFGGFQEFLAFKILLIFTIVGYIYKFVNKDRKIDRVALLVLGVTFILALKHLRHQAFFGIAAAIFSQHHYFYKAVKDFYQKITGKFFKLFYEKENAFSPVKTWIINILLLLFSVYFVFITPLTINAKEPDYPVRAVEFIKLNNLKGNLLTTFNWGSYALWKLYPQCLIFEDGRYEEVYLEESNSDLDKFVLNKENWQDILNKYHHDIILLNNDIAVLNKVKTLKSWKVIYQDDTSTILVPLSIKKNKWILPDKSNIYDKNKYLNTINF